MADSNTVAPEASKPAETKFVSTVTTQIRQVYDYVVTTMLTVIHFTLQPYVFFYNLAKSFFENCRDLLSIITLSIRAAQLYLLVWIRFLNGMNKDDKPAETVINTVKNIGTAVNNIYKKLQHEPGSSTQRDGSYSGTFPPIEEVSEPSSDNESGDASDSSSKAPGNTDSSRPIDGSGNGGGSSNGVRNNGRGRGSSGNVSPPMNSQSKAKVSFDPNVKEAPTNNTGSASQQGVDEVDSGKPKTSLKPAAPTKV